MGDEQRLTGAEQLRYAREQFESGPDLTVSVEEEFSILDPETLGLVNRFEEFQAAAAGTELEEHLAHVRAGRRTGRQRAQRLEEPAGQRNVSSA